MLRLSKPSEGLTSIHENLFCENEPWDPCRSTKAYCTKSEYEHLFKVCSQIAKTKKHQQDFLFSQTVKCHIFSLQYILVKETYFL